MGWLIGIIGLIAFIVVFPWVVYAFSWYYRWCEKKIEKLP